MHNCDLSHQVLAHQILPDINFANANLTGTDFRDDNLRRADMTRVKASGGLFDRAKLRSVYAPFGDFSHATMTETNLDFSEMTDAKLDGVDLRRGTLHGANLRGASLRGANLSSRITERAQGTPLVTDRVDLTDTNLEVADLTGADLTGALTTGWNILNARFDHTTCPDGTVVTKGATTPGTC